MTPLPGSPSAPNTAQEIRRRSRLGCMASAWLSTLPLSGGFVILGLLLYLLPKIVNGLTDHAMDVPPTAAWLMDQRTPAVIATLICMAGAIAGLFLGKTKSQRALFFSGPTVFIIIIAGTVILGLGQAYVELLGAAGRPL